MLFEAWQQSSLTGCAPAALVAAWPSLLCMWKAPLSTGMPAESWCEGYRMVFVVLCVAGWADLANNPVDDTEDLLR